MIRFSKILKGNQLNPMFKISYSKSSRYGIHCLVSQTYKSTATANSFSTQPDSTSNYYFDNFKYLKNKNDEPAVGGARMSVLMELDDQCGILYKVLALFWKYDVNLTRIESRPNPEYNNHKVDLYVVFEGKLDGHGSKNSANISKLLHDLKSMTNKLLILDDKKVDWFPHHISELDLIAKRILDAGKDLESDHPGFHDVEYRKRRAELASNAMRYTYDKPIPSINYTTDEIKTWSAVWDKLEPIWEKFACKQALASLSLMRVSLFFYFLIY